MEKLDSNSSSEKDGDGGDGGIDKKIKLLEKTVEADRPQPIDFIGKEDFISKKYYSREYVEDALRELSDKLLKEKRQGKEEDESAHLAEWEFTYALGHGETLPGCKANLASEYDDHLNGIDIICNLTDEKGKKHIFGIDVSTATLKEAVTNKFEKGDHPRGQVPSGCSFIKFYQDGDSVASIKGVPRFVLGTSPLFNGHQKYLDDFHVTDEGLISHIPNRDLKFNILSSLYLQSSATEKNLIKNPDGEETIRLRAIETCDAVRIASKNSLIELIQAKDKTEFTKKLNEEVAQAKEIKVNGYPDECYINVVRESILRHNKKIK